MGHSWVADGADSLKIWSMAANILNKQSWAHNKVILQLECMGITLSVRKFYITKLLRRTTN
jgi:hypothetical protein